MTVENPYSSPSSPQDDRGELIRKPQLSGFAIYSAAALNLLFCGAPGYFIIGQYAKGCVMGVVTLFSWLFGLGLIPTLVAMVDVVYLGERLRRGEGIETWEFFDKKTAPPPVATQDPDPALIYKDNGNLFLGVLGNLMLFGGGGYFATGQTSKAIATMLGTLVLSVFGIGLLIPFVTMVDVTVLVLRQRRGEGIGTWQFF